MKQKIPPVTVKKIQIAQAKECVKRCDKYIQALKALDTAIRLINPLARYNQFPEDYKVNQKQSLEAISADLKSMIAEASDLALEKAELAEELLAKREEQLKPIRALQAEQGG